MLVMDARFGLRGCQDSYSHRVRARNGASQPHCVRAVSSISKHVRSGGWPLEEHLGNAARECRHTGRPRVRIRACACTSTQETWTRRVQSLARGT